MIALLKACGAKYHIEVELLDETDIDDVVVALVSLARGVSYSHVYVFLFCSYTIPECKFSFQSSPS